MEDIGAVGGGLGVEERSVGEGVERVVAGGVGIADIVNKCWGSYEAVLRRDERTTGGPITVVLRFWGWCLDWTLWKRPGGQLEIDRGSGGQECGQTER